MICSGSWGVGKKIFKENQHCSWVPEHICRKNYTVWSKCELKPCLRRRWREDRRTCLLIPRLTSDFQKLVPAQEPPTFWEGRAATCFFEALTSLDEPTVLRAALASSPGACRRAHLGREEEVRTSGWPGDLPGHQQRSRKLCSIILL